MKTGTRKLNGTDLFSTNGRASKRVSDSDKLIQSLMLSVLYGYTPGSTAGTVLADAWARIINRIQVVGNFAGSRMPFLDAVPRDLHHLSTFLDPKTLPQEAEPVDGSASTNQPNLRSDFVLRFDAWGAEDPGQLGLPLMAVEGLEVIVDGAAAADIVTGEAGTPAFTQADGTAGTPASELYEKRFLETRRVPWFLQTLYTTHDIVSSTNGARLYLPETAPGTLLARVMVVEEVDDVLDDAVITDLGLVIDGREVHEKIDKDIYQRQNVQRYNLSAEKTGITLFDFADDGKFGDLYRIGGGERPYISADTAKQSGTNKVRVVAQYTRRPSRGRGR